MCYFIISFYNQTYSNEPGCFYCVDGFVKVQKSFSPVSIHLFIHPSPPILTMLT